MGKKLIITEKPFVGRDIAGLKKLISRADISSLINAGDAGREGQLIQHYIFNMPAAKNPLKDFGSVKLPARPHFIAGNWLRIK